VEGGGIVSPLKKGPARSQQRRKNEEMRQGKKKDNALLRKESTVIGRKERSRKGEIFLNKRAGKNAQSTRKAPLSRVNLEGWTNHVRKGIVDA